MKKIIAFIGFCFFICSPAVAYLEQNNSGDAKATAGEQNTNLYRLNAVGSTSIKKLKKIDEAIARNPNSITINSYTDLNSLLDDTKVREEKILRQLTKEIIQEFDKKPALTVVDNDIYHRFAELNQNSIRDNTMAQVLIKERARK